MPASNSILSEFDWDEGMTIPVANANNKSLEEEVNTTIVLTWILNDNANKY